MLRPKAVSWIIEICATLLILLFLYAAASKLMDYKRYWGEMNNQPFDNKFTTLLTIAIPAAEIITVLLLIIHKTRKWGFIASAFLMTIFSGYIALVLAKFYDRVPCTCGGVLDQLGWGPHLVVNIGFLALSLLGWRLITRKTHTPNVNGTNYFGGSLQTS